MRRERPCDLLPLPAAGFRGRRFDIKATLAFTQPEGMDTTRTGQGRGFCAFGVITGSVLTWNDLPQTSSSSCGEVEVEVDFEVGITILPLSSSLISGLPGGDRASSKVFGHVGHLRRAATRST